MKHWESMLMQQKATGKKGWVRAKVFYLGDQYENIYFTKREVESLYYLMNGHTISSTAKTLGLSPRTVEFYVNNMKLKIKATSKTELLEKALFTDLMHQFEEVVGEALVK